jgi:hypothetical protein
MTQDRYLGRKLTDRQTAEVLEGMFAKKTKKSKKGKGDPKGTRDLGAGEGASR